VATALRPWIRLSRRSWCAYASCSAAVPAAVAAGRTRGSHATNSSVLGRFSRVNCLLDIGLQGLLRVQRLLSTSGSSSASDALPLPRRSRKLIELPAATGATAIDAIGGSKPQLGVPLESQSGSTLSGAGKPAERGDRLATKVKQNLQRSLDSGAAGVGASQQDAAIAGQGSNAVLNGRGDAANLVKHLPDGKLPAQSTAVAGASPGGRAVSAGVPKQPRKQGLQGNGPSVHPVAAEVARTLREGKSSSYDKHSERAQQRAGSARAQLPPHEHDTDHDRGVGTGPQWQFDLDDRPVDASKLRLIPRAQQGLPQGWQLGLEQPGVPFHPAAPEDSKDGVGAAIGTEQAVPDLEKLSAQQATSVKEAWRKQRATAMAARAAAAAKTPAILKSAADPKEES
jgi:hypothetical protein